MATNGLTHILDYGCGSNTSLLRGFQGIKKDLPDGFRYQGYDPGVAKYAEPPIPAQLVACIDVLEHIEPELLENVLDHLAELTEVLCFLTIHTGPAGKVLSDGRNAHLIQKPPQWWLPKLMDRWTIQTYQLTPNGFWVIGHNETLEIEAKKA